VQDNDGEWSDWDNTTLVVYPNAPPVATGGSDVGHARFDDVIVFSGSGSDSDGSIVAYEWTSDIDGFLSNEEYFNITGFTVGNHTISFRVQDNDGDWSDWETSVLVISNTTACSPSYSMYLEKYVFYSLDEIDIWIDFKCLELNGLNEFEYYVYPINDPNDIMWSEAYDEDSWNINQESFTKGDQSIRKYKPAGYYHIVSELKNGGVVQHYDVITFCIKADDFDNACSYGSDGSGDDGSDGGGIPPLSVILTISAWVSLANIAIAVIALRLRPE
jgi:hypothetical protein